MVAVQAWMHDDALYDSVPYAKSAVRRASISPLGSKKTGHRDWRYRRKDVFYLMEPFPINRVLFHFTNSAASVGHSHSSIYQEVMEFSKLVSADEISRHSTPSDLWIVIEDTVWDVSAFAPEHPGGLACTYSRATSLVG